MSSRKKIKIAIIGSTGSIGTTSLKIIQDKKKLFNVELLVCNESEKIILAQIKKFSPKNVFIKNLLIQNKIKKKLNRDKLKVNFINKFEDINKIYSKQNKFDKVIIGISSINGLKYSMKFIKYSNEILLANKESLVCGGKILLNAAKKYNCKILSIDSEHYCIAETLKYEKMDNISSIYLTASGGPFFGDDKKTFAKAPISKVLKHPNWSMGKKISVDSATMANKIFEMIEAHVLFDIPIEKLKIKIHKESLIHSAVLFNNGLVKLIMHDTSMIIPIRNSLLGCMHIKKINDKNFFDDNKNFRLSFEEADVKNFQLIPLGFRVLKLGHAAWILFNVFNDYFVNKFLEKKIFFYQIEKNLIKIFSNKDINLYCKKKISNFKDVLKTIKYANNFVKNL